MRKSGNAVVVEAIEPRRLLAFSAAVNFSTAAAPRAPGLVKDYGSIYGDRRGGLSYGWSQDESDNAHYLAGRGLVRNRGYVAMHEGGNATWEIAVPDGNYSVFIVAGNAAALGDRMQIAAEDQILVSGVTKRGREFLEGSGVVAVSDGRLTIGSGSDAVNNKIDYVVIQSTTSEPNALTVRANAPAATEAAGPGAFTLTRSGDVTAALTVPITLGGTSTNGIDYGRIGSRVTFPAGVSSVKLPVRAVDDGLTEGDETVTLTLGAVGGYQLGTASATVTISDPTPSSPGTPSISSVSWTGTSSLPQGKSEPFGTTVGNTLYVFGGYVNTTYVPSTSAYKFNATTHTWSSIASLPTGTTQAGQTADGRYIYFAGGHVATSSSSQTFSTKHVYAYDTVNNTYASLSDLPAARGPGGLALVGRKLYFMGGSDSARNDVATVDALDLDNAGAGWQTKASMPAAENRFGVAVLDGKIYAVGGQTNYDNNAVHRNTLYRYDPAANTWATLHTLPRNISHNNASVFVAGGKIFTAGGEGDGLAKLSTVIAYDPAANAWSNFTGVPAARLSPVAAVDASGDVIFTGGFNTTFQTQTYLGTFA